MLSSFTAWLSNFLILGNMRMESWLLNLSQANLKDCIEGWSKAFCPAIKRKSIKFCIHVTEDAANFEMALDYNKIERLFYNLLSNALEFTNQGGTIRWICTTNGGE